ncbi:MAG: PD-(D/E)XK nuclease domain-containing protein [Eubacteriales bacterium]|nr:PD-(D/E)XK nuclease domain-containing protein [Eubacteriales bacterium]
MENDIRYITMKIPNREAGDGRYDVCLYHQDIEVPSILMELKVANHFYELDQVCDRALEQIRVKRYAQSFAEEGFREVLCYGIGFFRKQVRIKKEKLILV